MALLYVHTTTGETLLVHSSVFDGMKIVDNGEPRPAVATGSWAEVWERADATHDKGLGE